MVGEPLDADPRRRRQVHERARVDQRFDVAGLVGAGVGVHLPTTVFAQGVLVSDTGLDALKLCVPDLFVGAVVTLQ